MLFIMLCYFIILNKTFFFICLFACCVSSFIYFLFVCLFIYTGCTSGHGVCGLPRLSLRSVAAVGTFMTTGMITAMITRHVESVHSLLYQASKSEDFISFHFIIIIFFKLK